MSKVVIAILAAGSASRFGSPKQIATLSGKYILQYVLDIVDDLEHPSVCFLGANSKLIAKQLELPDNSWIEVPDWAEGPGAAIKAAVAYVQAQEDAADISGILFLLGDQPLIPTNHLESILQEASADEFSRICATEYTENEEGDSSRLDSQIPVNGVPAFFPKSYFSKLLNLGSAQGAKAMIKNEEGASVPLLFSYLVDIDTQADLQKLEEKIVKVQ